MCCAILLLVFAFQSFDIVGKFSPKALFLTKHASNCSEIKEILPKRLDAWLTFT